MTRFCLTSIKFIISTKYNNEEIQSFNQHYFNNVKSYNNYQNHNTIVSSA